MSNIEFKILAIPGGEKLQVKNVGFRFLTKKGPNDSGAMLLLQWCLVPQLVELLKDEKIDDAQVFVVVKNPHGNETRHVFDLSSPQELIEFHCSGRHKISGWVVADENPKIIRKWFLERVSRSSYEFEAERLFRYRESVVGRAELSVDVADGFFAPEMSVTQDWWVHLWFSEPAWDECALRRRKMVAYTVQPIVVGAFWTLLFVARLLYAFWTGGLLLRKDVPWEAVVRPFAYDTKDIWHSSERRWDEDSAMNLLTPIVLIPVVVIIAFLGWVISKIYVPVITSPAFVPVAVIIGMVITIWFVVKKLPKFLRKAVPEKAKQTWAHYLDDCGRTVDMWWDGWTERVQTKRLEKIYSDLSCVTAPSDGTVRVKRQGFTQNVVLTYHDIKTRVCRPTARH